MTAADHAAAIREALPLGTRYSKMRARNVPARDALDALLAELEAARERERELTNTQAELGSDLRDAQREVEVLEAEVARLASELAQTDKDLADTVQVAANWEADCGRLASEVERRFMQLAQADAEVERLTEALRRIETPTKQAEAGIDGVIRMRRIARAALAAGGRAAGDSDKEE